MQSLSQPPNPHTLPPARPDNKQYYMLPQDFDLSPADPSPQASNKIEPLSTYATNDTDLPIYPAILLSAEALHRSPTSQNSYLKGMGLFIAVPNFRK
jgi:hypothetical protein